MTAIKPREETLAVLEGRLHGLRTAPDVIGMEARPREKEAQQRLRDLRSLTWRNPDEARRALEALLEEPLKFTPTPDKHYVIEGPVFLGALFPNSSDPSGSRTLGHRLSPSVLEEPARVLDRVADQHVLLARPRRPWKLEPTRVQLLVDHDRPRPVPLRTFMLWPRLPTKANSARDRGSARIRSRTTGPSNRSWAICSTTVSNSGSPSGPPAHERSPSVEVGTIDVAWKDAGGHDKETQVTVLLEYVARGHEDTHDDSEVARLADQRTLAAAQERAEVAARLGNLARARQEIEEALAKLPDSALKDFVREHLLPIYNRAADYHAGSSLRGSSASFLKGKHQVVGEASVARAFGIEPSAAESEMEARFRGK